MFSFFNSTLNNSSIGQTKEKVLVIKVRGQSGASGREVSSVLVNASKPTVLNDVLIFNTDTKIISEYNVTSVAENNVVLDSPTGANSYDFLYYLAQSLRDRYGVKVLIYKYSVGGTSITRWQDGGDLLQDWNSLYSNFQFASSQYNLIEGVTLWYQGEADAGTLADATGYEALESTMYSRDIENNHLGVNADTTINAQKIISIIPTGVGLTFLPELTTSKINNASSFTHVSTVDADGFDRRDNLHLSDLGYQQLTTALEPECFSVYDNLLTPII